MEFDIRYQDCGMWEQVKNYVRYLLFPLDYNPIETHPGSMTFRICQSYNSAGYYMEPYVNSLGEHKLSSVTPSFQEDLTSIVIPAVNSMVSTVSTGITGVVYRKNMQFRASSLKSKHMIISDPKMNGFQSLSESNLIIAPYSFGLRAPMFCEHTFTGDLSFYSRIMFSDDNIENLFSVIRPVTSNIVLRFDTTDDSPNLLNIFDLYSRYTDIMKHFNRGHSKNPSIALNHTEAYCITTLPSAYNANYLGKFNRSLFLQPLLHSYNTTLTTVDFKVINFISNGVLNCRAMTNWEGILHTASPFAMKNDSNFYLDSSLVYECISDIEDFYLYPISRKEEMKIELNNRFKDGSR